MTRVLVVDDDLETAELLRVVLEDADLDVAVATDERRLPKGPFDCIVTDLPQVAVYTRDDARDWLLRLADRYPSVPQILVTGHTAARGDRDALGVRTVIMKPFDVDELVAAVREASAP